MFLYNPFSSTLSVLLDINRMKPCFSCQLPLSAPDLRLMADSEVMQSVLMGRAKSRVECVWIRNQVRSQVTLPLFSSSLP